MHDRNHVVFYDANGLIHFPNKQKKNDILEDCRVSKWAKNIVKVIVKFQVLQDVEWLNHGTVAHA